ncbi:SCP-like protein [Ancylostoma caninum]|uniref:SCP-like protein n=1 Tax=Ancylostoma caninum TaxID=29170 RepID=A0A368GZD9_ANCCA|nr:SCP-like protein [Ancylostoma caninum]
MKYFFVVSYFFVRIGYGKISIIQVLFTVAGIANGEYKCSQKPGIDDELRESFVETHNGYRSLLAKGRAFMQDYADSLPASKMRSLRDLLNQVYDCAAEDSAYESAKKCSTTASSTSNYNENLYVFEDEDGVGASPIVEAVNSWTSEALDLDQAATKNLYRSSYKISNFANVARDTTEKVGCAVVKCGSKTHLVCHYSPKVEAEGKPIYEQGEPCSRCSAYGSSSCEEGLCVAN